MTWRRTALGATAARALGVVLLLCAGAGSPLRAENGSAAVEIRVSLENRDHHEARIEVTFPDAPDPLDVRMSRSSPGRYALHEFAKNVYSVAARASGRDPLAVEQPDPHGWRVSGHGAGRTVVFAYTLFGDLTDGTYVGIDETHAHLNPPAAFVWAHSHAKRPVRVVFGDLPEGWRVSTQLTGAQDHAPRTFLAPDLAYLLDSPIEASDHEVYEWRIPGPADEPSREQTMRLALHHLGSEEEARRFVELAEAVAGEEIALFGEAPRFDFGSYTFLADYLPWADGDGMEHRNSTVLTSSRPLSTGTVENLGTVAHELVHAWSIERLRPDALEPFDFERENPSGELWFGEGFTSYYDDLVLRRAGAISFDVFLERVSRMVEAIRATPARAYGSAVAMSRRAPFHDAASWVDPTNARNVFFSYYSYGSALGLALDLELRARDRTLDDFMAAMWRRFGRAEEQYSNEDLRVVLGEVSGDPAFAEQFFERYVHGSELPEYDRLLAEVGLVLRPARPGKAWLGEPELRFVAEGAEVVAPTLAGSPLYEAGIDRLDVLLEIDGERPRSEEWLRKLLARRKPGDELRVLVRGRGTQIETVVVLGEDPTVEVVAAEATGKKPSREALERREAWLASRAGERAAATAAAFR